MNQDKINQIQKTNTLSSPHKQNPNTGSKLQFKQGLAGLSYSQQINKLSPGPIQAKGDTKGGIHDTAREGLTGNGQKLPFLEQIQPLFGGHDLSGVKAFIGEQAKTSNEEIGSDAYTSGESIAFKSSPDLRTVAHEAAHVIQQRKGVSLTGGVGQKGDPYEKHADQIAEMVVQGKSVEDALEQYGGEEQQQETPENEAIQQKGPGNKNGPLDFQSAPALKFKMGGKDISLNFKDGLTAEVDMAGITFPKATTPGGQDGWKKSKAFNIDLVPGAGVRFEAGVGGSISLGGKASFGVTKKKVGNKTQWELKAKGGGYAKADIWGELAIGGFVGCSAANISASFYGKASVSPTASLGVEAAMIHDSQKGWTGQLKFPVDLAAELALAVGLKANWEFLLWDGEIGRFEFGKWVLGSAGANVTPGIEFPGNKNIGSKIEPFIKWGAPPKPKNMGDSKGSGRKRTEPKSRYKTMGQGTKPQRSEWRRRYAEAKQADVYPASLFKGENKPARGANRRAFDRSVDTGKADYSFCNLDSVEEPWESLQDRINAHKNSRAYLAEQANNRDQEAPKILDGYQGTKPQRSAWRRRYEEAHQRGVYPWYLFKGENKPERSKNRRLYQKSVKSGQPNYSYCRLDYKG